MHSVQKVIPQPQRASLLAHHWDNKSLALISNEKKRNFGSVWHKISVSQILWWKWNFLSGCYFFVFLHFPVFFIQNLTNQKNLWSAQVSSFLIALTLILALFWLRPHLAPATPTPTPLHTHKHISGRTQGILSRKCLTSWHAYVCNLNGFPSPSQWKTASSQWLYTTLGWGFLPLLFQLRTLSQRVHLLSDIPLKIYGPRALHLLLGLPRISTPGQTK